MVEKTYHSGSWYKIADLRPRLRSHAPIHRHHYRGDLWYVLQDRTSGRFHRFTPEAYLVISLMDGHRTVQAIWDIACERLADDVLTQDEVIRLLGQLHGADVLRGDVPPDILEMTERGRRQRRRKIMSSLMNPLALRLPLFDPDKVLGATLPLVRPMFTALGAVVYLAILAYGCILAGRHWAEFTENITGRMLATDSLLVLMFAYPVVKALHELGHAYAIKRWGGEVHEIGVMFLVFLPVPYVDASDSVGFHEKWRRALVAAAGILVELLLAAIAMVVWVNSDESLVKAFAFSVVLIGGVSTALFNGNPLLRFDGYYVLCDLLEIPNLGTRANAYVGYLIQRYAFGATVQSPATADGEPFWLFVYALASFAYRLVITSAIVLFVGTHYFIFGVLIAIWALVLMFAVPIAKHLRFLVTSPSLRRVRGRAFAVTGGVLAILACVMLILPLPHATIAEGVVWVPGESFVHARADGVVSKVVTPANAETVAGGLLLELYEPPTTTRAKVLEGRVAELGSRRVAQELVSPAEAKIAREELRQAQADLDLARQRERDLLIRSATDGQFILPRAADLVGRFVKKGEVLGYVARFEEPTIRAIVPEDRADLVRQQTLKVEVRFVSDPARDHAAAVRREVPALTETVPSPALTTQGGGQVMLHPSDPRRERVMANLLHLDIKLDDVNSIDRLGERVHVRFSHPPEPLATRLYRELRQVFLQHFKV